MTICKARLESDSVVYDIGAGTGSIAVEAALLVREGIVYAVEREWRAAETIAENAARLGVVNLHVVRGEAPEALAGLPPADRIIVGGSGGRLRDILEASRSKLRERGRIVVNAVTIETAAGSIKLLEDLGFCRVDACCLTVARARRVGKSRIMKGLNPVFLVVGER